MNLYGDISVLDVGWRRQVRDDIETGKRQGARLSLQCCE